MKEKKQNLLNKNQIEFLLKELHNELTKEEKKPIVAELAFDAATFDPHDNGSTRIIVFNAQTLEGENKTKVIYVEKKKKKW